MSSRIENLAAAVVGTGFIGPVHVEGLRGITSYPGGHNEGFPDTFKQLFRSFYGYIAAGDFSAPSPFPTFADGHREILLCEAVLRSHRERRWVSIEECF